MPKTDNRITLVASVVCLALGWWLATSPSSPVRPDFRSDRPVLRFLAKMAKMSMWIMLAGEEPPTNNVAQHDPHALNHAEGW